VFLETLVPLGKLEQQDRRVFLELVGQPGVQVLPDQTARRDLLASRELREDQGTRGLQVLQVLPVWEEWEQSVEPGRLVREVPRVLTGLSAVTDQLDRQGRPVPRDHWAQLGAQDPRDVQGLLEQRALTAQLGSQVVADRQDFKALPETLVQSVPLVDRDPPGTLAHLEHQEQTVLPELQDQLDQGDPLVCRVPMDCLEPPDRQDPRAEQELLGCRVSMDCRGRADSPGPMV